MDELKNKFNAEIDKTIQGLEKELIILNRQFVERGLEEFNGKMEKVDGHFRLGRVLPIFRTLKDDKDPVLQRIEGIVKHACNVIDITKKHLETDEYSWATSRNRERQIFNEQKTMNAENRKAERDDMWNLWAQKAVRWSLGAVIAVLLYSSFVFVAEQCDFIKIPIKDLIVPTQSIDSK